MESFAVGLYFSIVDSKRDDCDVQRLRGRNGLVLKDDVPFSCCKPSVLRPCVHHAMRDRSRHSQYPVGNSTLFGVGCSAAVRQHTAAVGSLIFYGLVALAGGTMALVVVCRYLQTSVAEALYAGDMTLPARGYLLSFGPRNAPGTRAPPSTPVTSPEPSAGKRRRDRNVNKSNVDANNSVAMYELADELLSESASQWSANSDLELIADQLAPSPLSDRTQTTSGELSRDSTSLPAAVDDVSVTPSPEVPVVRSSLSSSVSVVDFPASSRSPSLQENVNSNCNATVDHRLRRSRGPARSDAATLIIPGVSHGRDQGDVVVSRRGDAGSQSSNRRKNTEQLHCSRRGSATTSGPPCGPTRFKAFKYSDGRTKSTLQARKRQRSSSESITSSGSESSASLRSVERDRRVKDHERTRNDRHIVQAQVCSLRHPCTVSNSSRLLAHNFRRKTPHGSSPAEEPNRRGTSTRERQHHLLPMTKTLGLPEEHGGEGRSSGLSTVSTQTIGDVPVTSSKHKTLHITGGLHSPSAAAFLNMYFRNYTKSRPHESTKCRSTNSSKKTLSTGRVLASSDRTAWSPRNLTKNAGRSSSNSWSTVSCRSVSRPTSSEFHDDQQASRDTNARRPSTRRQSPGREEAVQPVVVDASSVTDLLSRCRVQSRPSDVFAASRRSTIDNIAPTGGRLTHRCKKRSRKNKKS